MISINKNRFSISLMWSAIKSGDTPKRHCILQGHILVFGKQSNMDRWMFCVCVCVYVMLDILTDYYEREQGNVFLVILMSDTRINSHSMQKQWYNMIDFPLFSVLIPQYFPVCCPNSGFHSHQQEPQQSWSVPLAPQSGLRTTLNLSSAVPA